MIDRDYTDKMTTSEWVERRVPGEMGMTIGETYRLKEDAPEDFKKEWEEFCALFDVYG